MRCFPPVSVDACAYSAPVGIVLQFHHGQVKSATPADPVSVSLDPSGRYGHAIRRARKRAGCKPIASRTLVETMIAAMAEEARGILRGDAVEGGTERLFECLDGAGRDTAQV